MCSYVCVGVCVSVGERWGRELKTEVRAMENVCTCHYINTYVSQKKKNHAEEKTVLTLLICLVVEESQKIFQMQLVRRLPNLFTSVLLVSTDSANIHPFLTLV